MHGSRRARVSRLTFARIAPFLLLAAFYVYIQLSVPLAHVSPRTPAQAHGNWVWKDDGTASGTRQMEDQLSVWLGQGSASPGSQNPVLQQQTSLFLCNRWRSAYHVSDGTALSLMSDRMKAHWHYHDCETLLSPSAKPKAQDIAEGFEVGAEGEDDRAGEFGVDEYDEESPEELVDGATEAAEEARSDAQQFMQETAEGKFAPGITHITHHPALVIKVLTYNRGKSLSRLLSSLNNANYDADHVNLEIWVDNLRVASRQQMEREFIGREEVLSIARNFEWDFGAKQVIERPKNFGLVGQWLHCWTDEDSKRGFRSAVVILEDDMQMSPLFWLWLKPITHAYRRRQDLFGISLQNQHLVASSGASNLKVDNDHAPFLYKVPGSWGFSPHPLAWEEFTAWFRRVSQSDYQPSDLQFKGKDVITSTWWKHMRANGEDPRMWTAWAMRFMEDRGLFCLYSNLPQNKAFCSSWNEPGEHDPGEFKGRLSTPLVTEWDARCEAAPASPWRIDFDGSRITTPELPLRPRKCDLSGTNVVFDGYIYHLQHGKTEGGVAKMWWNIVPHMIAAVTNHSGIFTACAYAGLMFEGAVNVDCKKLQAVPDLPGAKKVLFSSYYQGTPDVCFVHMVYDHIPERTGMDVSPGTEYWPRIDNLRHAGGFLSISKSTTDDLCELYGMCDPNYISTSDNRAAPLFKPASPRAVSAFKAKHGITKPYILGVGKRYGYKNYGIMWDGIHALPEDVKSKYMVLLLGEEEAEDHGIEVKALQGVEEADMPTVYTGAAVFVYPSKYEGFGMPPVEAAGCGASLILGPFHRDRMHHVFGELAQYATTGEEMAAAMLKMDRGEVAEKRKLIERAKLYGTDTRHGWNEVAKDYLEYLIHGPFRSHTLGGRHCAPLVDDPDDCRFVSTPDSIRLAD